jgi:hypothetical protein
MVPTIEHVENVVKVIGDTSKKTGRSREGFLVACHLITTYSENPEEALRNAKMAIEEYAAVPPIGGTLRGSDSKGKWTL